MNSDITYCAYVGCPLKSCDRHLCRCQNRNEYVSVCDFAPTCRKYLTYLLDEITNEQGVT